MGFGTINSGGAKPQDLSGYLKTEQLGKAGGVAPLDEQAKIILDYLYTNAANALAKLDANGKLPTDLIPTLSAYIAATARGAANGVASLDESGKLPSGQLTSHSHAYSDITGKPSTFPPASHSHAASEITGLAAYLAGAGYGMVATGSYVGDGTGSANSDSYNKPDSWTNPRTILLPFAPTIFLLSSRGTAFAFCLQGDMISSASLGLASGYTGVYTAYLNGSKLSVIYTGCTSMGTQQTSRTANVESWEYTWLAVK